MIHIERIQRWSDSFREDVGERSLSASSVNCTVLTVHEPTCGIIVSTFRSTTSLRARTGSEPRYDCEPSNLPFKGRGIPLDCLTLALLGEEPRTIVLNAFGRTTLRVQNITGFWRTGPLELLLLAPGRGHAARVVCFRRSRRVG